MNRNRYGQWSALAILYERAGAGWRRFGIAAVLGLLVVLASFDSHDRCRDHGFLHSLSFCPAF